MRGSRVFSNPVTYVQLDDYYKTYLTSLNDIFMLYEVKITDTKNFLKGGTAPPWIHPCTTYIHKNLDKIISSNTITV